MNNLLIALLAFLYICAVKVNRIIILSFWFLALLWGAMGTAWTYSTSASGITGSYSEESIKNNLQGVQLHLNGVEDVVPNPEKFSQEQLFFHLTSKKYCRSFANIPTNYNFTHPENIYNPRDVLGTQIYPSHFFW